GVHHLRAEAAMYRGSAASDRARFLRGCAGGDAPAGDRRSDLDEAAAGNSRASFWNDEMADGPPEIPGQGIAKSQSRTGPGGAELQSQTGHQHSRSASAAASACPSPRLRTNLTSQQSPPSCRGKKIPDFSHSLVRRDDG